MQAIREVPPIDSYLNLGKKLILDETCREDDSNPMTLNMGRSENQAANINMDQEGVTPLES